MDEYGRVAVPSDAASVWMSEMELVKFFDVIAPTLRAAIRAVYKSGGLNPCEVERPPTLRAAIRAVYKSGGLNPCEVERHIRLTNGYYSETYSLPMVVAVAFRINTSNAVMVRKALLERLCLRKERQILLVSMDSKPSCGC